LGWLNRRPHHCDGLSYAQERAAPLSHKQAARHRAVDRQKIGCYADSEFRLTLSWSKTRLHIERSDVRMSSSNKSSCKRQCVVAESPSHITLTPCTCVDLSIATIHKSLSCRDVLPKSLIRTCPQRDKLVLQFIFDRDSIIHIKGEQPI
jgi:hypothetical protein